MATAAQERHAGSSVGRGGSIERGGVGADVGVVAESGDNGGGAVGCEHEGGGGEADNAGGGGAGVKRKGTKRARRPTQHARQAQARIKERDGAVDEDSER